jgi:hypothetical protein
MSNNIYKITLKEQRGALYIGYKQDGQIKEAVFMFDPKIENRHFTGLLRDNFPMYEADLDQLRVRTEGKWDYELLVPRNASDKIAMFCMTFREYRSQPYTAKKNEKANIAEVTVTKQLLQVYFGNVNFPLTYAKSVSDYIKHYNYIRDIAANGKPVKSGFPDVYDREYERTLEGEKISAYWQHLISIGWKKIDGVWTKALKTYE